MSRRFSTEPRVPHVNVHLDVVHRYRGTIAGDTIAFYVQTEGGPASLPIEFTATRVVTK